MSKMGDMVSVSKLTSILKKRDDERIKKTILWILAILGAAVAIAGIAYAVYRFVTPNYLKDFEEDFDEDFDDDFLEAEEIE